MSEAKIRDSIVLSPDRSANAASASTIGTVMREARIKKGYKQNELADLVGVSTAQWSRLEGDVNRPSRDTLKKTSAYLGVPFHQLVMLAGYSGLKTDRTLYNKKGEVIDTDEIINSIFCVDCDLLDCLTHFEEIGTMENVSVLIVLLRAMRKEVAETGAGETSDGFFLKSFRALKQFITESYLNLNDV